MEDGSESDGSFGMSGKEIYLFRGEFEYVTQIVVMRVF